MSNSNKHGTASLSKSQREQLAQFRRSNFVLLKNLKITEIVQIWRDGFICGAIHGFDKGRSLGRRDTKAQRLHAKKRGRGQS